MRLVVGKKAIVSWVWDKASCAKRGRARPHMLSTEKDSVKTCNNQDVQSFCPSEKGNIACTSIVVRLGDALPKTRTAEPENCAALRSLNVCRGLIGHCAHWT
eukprot:2774367-Prorocentrum_lima.AAC.1